jgi:hypothetical protein
MKRAPCTEVRRVSLTPEADAALVALAARRRVPVAELVREAIDALLSPVEAPAAPAPKRHPWRSLACSPRTVPGGRKCL